MLDNPTASPSPAANARPSKSKERAKSSLPVERVFSLTVTEYEWREVTVDFSTGERRRRRVPKAWSDNAAATLMSKYAVRSGVPEEMGGDLGGREVDAERIFDRLVAGWRAAAIEHGYWPEGDENLALFCAEVKAMLEQQLAAPNSPQWFNTGVAVQYGIEAGTDGHHFATVDEHGNATAHACSDSLTHPQISACFIQSIDDKLVGDGGIMDLWEREARLFKYGSGSGANYSALRGKGEPLSRGGESSGLLSFLRVGDRSAGAIKSGGTTRRSARMVIVDVDHPDIEEFIGWKAREDDKIRALHAAGYGDPASFEDEATETVSGQNANNSVSVTDDFMQAVVDGGTWDLTRRTDGEACKTVDARLLWHDIAEAAWKCADPGLQFFDTINGWHTCVADGPIRGCNPCAEYIHLDDTACNLASLNLARYSTPVVPWTGFDHTKFRHAVRLWTIVLDISVSMAGYPTAEIAKRSMLYRTLGLGYAALGELLVKQALGYGTATGRRLAARITEEMTRIAYKTSVELARHLGPFPRFEANREHVLAVLGRHSEAALKLGGYRPAEWYQIIADAKVYGVRNAQVTLLAPCGTIGIVMDCETTGVEPYYSDTAVKTLAGGGTMRLVSRRFAETLRAHDHDPGDHKRTAYTAEGGRVLEYTWVDPPEELRDVLVCADDLTPEQHVDMMAAVQPFLSGAISKTVNMPSTATVDDVAGMYMYAWRSGLKSIAIYRDGCKPSQPLQGRKPGPGVRTYATREEAEHAAQIDTFVEGVAATATDEARRMRIGLDGRPLQGFVDDVAFTFDGRPTPTLARGERLEPPAEANGVKHRVELGGHTFYLHLYEHDNGSLAEVFVTCSRTGSGLAGWVNAWAKLFSLGLQHGTPLAVLVSAMRGAQFDPTGFHGGRPALSPVDAFARIIDARYLSADDGPAEVRECAEVQPRQPAAEPPAKATGGMCDACGSADLRRSGACFVCGTCGTTTGCS